ncbi:MAG: pyridoxamine 5'-phosphate oxidase family protein [Oscillospiraceae bacterium]|nr:pyridoxamine 5'-phosphate oxidase family protein [Oscillospiraceae bacterium]
MFRELVRIKQRMPQEACIELLKKETRGVLCVLGDDDYPYGAPINHFYDEESGKIYFHVGTQRSHRNDSIRKHDKVSLAVYNQGYKNEGEWFYNVESVIVFGRIAIVEDKDTVVDITTKLCHKFNVTQEYIDDEIRNHLHRTVLLELTPEHISGKYVKES